MRGIRPRRWRRYQWLLKSAPLDAKKITPEKVKELEDEHNRVRPKFAEAKGRVRNQWSEKTTSQMAREIGRDVEYDLPYSLAASIHHANPEGMLAYVDAKTEKFVLDAPPSLNWVTQALTSAHGSELQALDTLNGCCRLGFEDRIKSAEQQFHAVWKTEASRNAR